MQKRGNNDDLNNVMETVINEMKTQFHAVPVFQHTMGKRFVFPPLIKNKFMVEPILEKSSRTGNGYEAAAIRKISKSTYQRPNMMEEILRPYKDKDKALIQAVKDKNERAIELLVKEPSCNINQVDEYDRTPLFIAVEKGFDRVVQTLLKQVSTAARSCFTITFEYHYQ